MTHWLLQCNPDRYDTDHPDWLAHWGMARVRPGCQTSPWRPSGDLVER